MSGKELFNNGLKTEFLKHTEDVIGAASRKAATAFFEKTEDYERNILGKDIYAMNIDELKAMFYYLGETRVNTATAYIKFTRDYVSWCAERGIIEVSESAMQLTPQNAISNKSMLLKYPQSREQFCNFIKLCCERDTTLRFCPFYHTRMAYILLMLSEGLTEEELLQSTRSRFSEDFTLYNNAKVSPETAEAARRLAKEVITQMNDNMIIKENRSKVLSTRLVVLTPLWAREIYNHAFGTAYIYTAKTIRLFGEFMRFKEFLTEHNEKPSISAVAKFRDICISKGKNLTHKSNRVFAADYKNWERACKH